MDISDLLCNESLEQPLVNMPNESNLQANEYDPLDPANPFVLESDELEHIQDLVTRETLSASPVYVDSLSTNAFRRNIRSECVEWMISAYLDQGYHPLTGYLSVTYFHRFLSRRAIDDTQSWAYYLLCLVCFGIAAKMEESKVPDLESLSVGREEYSFMREAIKDMEKTALSTLGWRLASITPFDYLQYFIVKMCPSSIQKEVFHKVSGILMESVKEVHFLYHRASVIAAAAVLAASGTELTRDALELKLAAIASIGPLNIDHVYSCYIAMRDIGMRLGRTPPTSIVNPLQRVRASNGGGTRRRLEFGESSRQSPPKRSRQQ